MTEQNLRTKIQKLLDDYKYSLGAGVFQDVFTSAEDAAYYNGIKTQLNSSIYDLEEILKDDN